MAVFVVLTFIFVVLGSSTPASAGNKGDLQFNYYQKTCPQAENIINAALRKAMIPDIFAPAALIRLLLHDCLINGCDGSILLDETPSGEPVERKSPANIGIRALEVIHNAKARLEQECPETVSCADIVAFVARDSVVASGLSYYQVPAGRRDGLISRANDTKGNLPEHTQNVSEMSKIFAKKGMSLYDMVILLGAHSVGAVHCSSIESRLYEYSKEQTMDPKLDQVLALTLKTACPKVKLTDRFVSFDLISPTRLDNLFYKRILAGKGLLSSDQELMEDPKSREIVEKMASDSNMWKREFAKAMVRLGRTDVKTGQQGQIRKDCRFVNQ